MVLAGGVRVCVYSKVTVGSKATTSLAINGGYTSISTPNFGKRGLLDGNIGVRQIQKYSTNIYGDDSNIRGIRLRSLLSPSVDEFYNHFIRPLEHPMCVDSMLINVLP